MSVFKKVLSGVVVLGVAASTAVVVNAYESHQPVGFKSGAALLTAYHRCDSNSDEADKAIGCADKVIKEGIGEAQATAFNSDLVRISKVSSSLALDVVRETMSVSATTYFTINNVPDLTNSTTPLQYISEEILAIAQSVPGNLTSAQVGNLKSDLSLITNVDVYGVISYSWTSMTSASLLANANQNPFTPNNAPASQISEVVGQLLRTAQGKPVLAKSIATTDIAMFGYERRSQAVADTNAKLIAISSNDVATAQRDSHNIFLDVVNGI